MPRAARDRCTAAAGRRAPRFGMDELRVGPVRITLVRGDVTDQPDAGAIVNAANAERRPDAPVRHGTAPAAGAEADGPLGGGGPQ